jgi:5-methylcytosine-specific restriction protein A
MTIAIFKTSAKTLPGVLEHCRHALSGSPTRLQAGDTILVAKIRAHLTYGERPIGHRMTFESSQEDVRRETDQIWGDHWRWIINSSNTMKLLEPFDIYDVQVTSMEYGRGGTVVYLDPLDERELERRGLL